MKESGLRLGLALAVGALAVGALANGVGVAQAHGRHAGEINLFRGVKGPYDVLVSAVPFVGFLEVIVTFEPGGEGAQLGYAPRVLVSVSNGTTTLGPKAAARVLLSTVNDYSATFEPEAAGEWTVVIGIDSELGNQQLRQGVTVIRSGGFPWPALLAGLGIVLPIAWLALKPPRGRRRRPSRR